MNPEQIMLVESSFERIAQNSDGAARLFYDRLFAIAPGVRSFFADDMGDQRRKLMAMLAAVVAGLSKPESIIPMVQHLGVRHSAYGAVSDHYPVVGEALIWMLRETLGEAFDKDTETAWTAAYALLSSLMIEASEKDRQGAAI